MKHVNHKMQTEKEKTLLSIRRYIIFFICVLMLVGITTFPLEKELAWITSHDAALPSIASAWLLRVYSAVKETNHTFPFLSYGTDWLAYAHIVIALLFIGPYRDPIKNIWVIEWAMLACLIILPVAIIAGSVRGIPSYHICVDCAFGIFGIIPLLIIRRNIRKLEYV